MEQEQPESTLLIQDALVRFVRKHHDDLRDAEWYKIFREKVLLLHEQRVIGDETLAYCLECRKEVDGGAEGASRAGAERAGRDAQTPDRDRATPGLANGQATNRERRKWVNGKFVSLSGGPDASPRGASAELTPRAVNGVVDTIAKRTTNGGGTDSPSPAPSRVSGMCSCGHSAAGQRGGIACTNMVRCYHLQLLRRIHC